MRALGRVCSEEVGAPCVVEEGESSRGAQALRLGHDCSELTGAGMLMPECQVKLNVEWPRNLRTYVRRCFETQQFATEQGTKDT